MYEVNTGVGGKKNRCIPWLSTYTPLTEARGLSPRTDGQTMV